MIALSFVGGFILAFFLWIGTKVRPDEEGNGITSSAFISVVLIIGLSGFLVAAGLLG